MQQSQTPECPSQHDQQSSWGLIAAPSSEPLERARRTIGLYQALPRLQLSYASRLYQGQSVQLSDYWAEEIRPLYKPLQSERWTGRYLALTTEGLHVAERYKIRDSVHPENVFNTGVRILTAANLLTCLRVSREHTSESLEKAIEHALKASWCRGNG